MYNISVVIQGPLHTESLRCLSNYLLYSDDIIISYWEEDDESLLIDLPPAITLVKDKCPPHHPHFGSLEKQIVSTLNGCKRAKYPHILKVRADESYTNIGPICEYIINNPHKLTTNNVWFTNTPYHCSDHMWGGETLLIIDFLESFFLPAIRNTSLLPDVIRNKIGSAVEIILGSSWVYFREPEANLAENKSLTRKHIGLIPVSSLGSYIVKACGNTFTTDEQIRKNPSIFSLDEL